MKSLLCVAGLAGLVVPAAHAASFDCAKATRPVEKLICRDKNLNALDERLGQVYRAGLQKLPTALTSSAANGPKRSMAVNVTT